MADQATIYLTEITVDNWKIKSPLTTDQKSPRSCCLRLHLSVGTRLTEMLLDPVQDVHAHLAVHHVDGQSPFAKSTRAANPVQVCLVVWVTILVYGQVKVDHHGNLLDIDT